MILLVHVVVVLAAGCGEAVEAEAMRLTYAGNAADLAAVRARLERQLDARRSSAADGEPRARTLAALAEVTDAMGDASEAGSLFQQAAALEERLGHLGHASRLKARRAMVLSDRDNRAGVALASEALAEATAAADGTARALALLARGSGQQHLAAAARADLREARALFRAAGETRWAMTALTDLGWNAANAGQVDEALGAGMVALITDRWIGDLRGEAAACLLISYVYNQLLQDYAHARGYASDAVALARRTGDVGSLATGLDALGVIERIQHHPAEAVAYHREALELEQRLQHRIRIAETTWSYATALRALGRYDEAIALVRTAVAAYHDLGDRDREGVMLWEQAAGTFKAGRLAEAIPLADRALELRDETRAHLAGADRRASFSDQLRWYFDLPIALRLKHAAATGDPQAVEDALLISERARARSLMDTLSRADVRAPRDRGARRQAEIEVELARLEAQLDALEAAEDRDPLERAIERRRAEYEALEDQRSDGGGRRASLDAAGLRAIQAQLEPDTIVIEIYLATSPPMAVAWGVTRDQIAWIDLGSTTEIDARSRALYDALTARTRGTQDATAADAAVARWVAELGAQLVAPLAPHLRGKHRVVVIPDGALSYLPLAILTDAAGTPVGRDHVIVEIPSLSALEALRARRLGAPPPSAGLAIFADPVFGPADRRVQTNRAHGGATAATSVPLRGALRDMNLEDLGRLHFTRDEAVQLASLLPPGMIAMHLGFDAQKQPVLDGALRRYRWVHFATHGIVDSGRPDRSGLVLSMVAEDGAPRDGFLRLAEIYDLSLSADLVVLSACQTALGREIRRDGLLSLTRGFLEAGARMVLATLWRVDDRATARFMATFYRALLVDHAPPEAALTAAQRAMQADPTYHAPYYWAGFQLQGDWRPANLSQH